MNNELALKNNQFIFLNDSELTDIDGGILTEILVGIAAGFISAGICLAVDSAVEKITGKSVAQHVCDWVGW